MPSNLDQLRAAMSEVADTLIDISQTVGKLKSDLDDLQESYLELELSLVDVVEEKDTGLDIDKLENTLRDFVSDLRNKEAKLEETQ